MSQKTDEELMLEEADRLEVQYHARLAEMNALEKGSVAHSMAKRRFNSAMQELADFRSYWRNIGAALGLRTGVSVQNNTEEN
jgi:hypothetical protein